MRTINVGTVSSPAANTLLYNFLHTIGGDTLETNEGAAALRSFNRYARIARERMRWPEATMIKQVIPDIRVRGVNVTNGGSGYDSGATVAFSGGGGSGATATATTNSDDEVNGVAVTAEGTGYTAAPTVTINAVSGGSGATAKAVIVAYIDYGSTEGNTGTVGDLLRVTESDPLTSSSNVQEVPFKVMHESGSDFGVALLINRTSTAPVWATYRFAEEAYTETGGANGAMPYVWSEYVVQGAYADWLRASEQHRAAQLADAQAEQTLLMEIDKLERQGQQFQHTQYQSHHINAPHN
jgi:hypothetical protein